MNVEEAVRQVMDIEVEEDKGDPFEGMNNAQIAEIYYIMKPEDQCLFRQFKCFHSYIMRPTDMTPPATN